MLSQLEEWKLLESGCELAAFELGWNRNGEPSFVLGRSQFI